MNEGAINISMSMLVNGLLIVLALIVLVAAVRFGAFASWPGGCAADRRRLRPAAGWRPV